jgi:hypothetical protein
MFCTPQKVPQQFISPRRSPVRLCRHTLILASPPVYPEFTCIYLPGAQRRSYHAPRGSSSEPRLTRGHCFHREIPILKSSLCAEGTRQAGPVLEFPLPFLSHAYIYLLPTMHRPLPRFCCPGRNASLEAGRCTFPHIN